MLLLAERCIRQKGICHTKERTSGIKTQYREGLGFRLGESFHSVVTRCFKQTQPSPVEIYPQLILYEILRSERPLQLDTGGNKAKCDFFLDGPL